MVDLNICINYTLKKSDKNWELTLARRLIDPKINKKKTFIYLIFSKGLRLNNSTI